MSLRGQPTITAMLNNHSPKLLSKYLASHPQITVVLALIKRTSLCIQSECRVVEPSLKWYIYNSWTQCPVITVEDGACEVCKSEKNRAFAVRLCLLGMSEATVHNMSPTGLLKHGWMRTVIDILMCIGKSPGILSPTQKTAGNKGMMISSNSLF